MKDLKKLYIEVLEDVIGAGIDTGFISDVTVNYRAKKRAGQARYIRREERYTINISSFALNDRIDDQVAKNVIAHEIIHCAEGRMNHGAEWKRQAAILMKCNPKYRITRTTNMTEFGIEQVQKTEDSFRYLYKCEGCGQMVGRNRESKVTMNIDRYRCGICHGKFITIRRPDDRQLLVAAMRFPS